MHGGSFVPTPTPPLSGRRTQRSGPMRLCVCLLFWAGSGGPVSGALFGAPHLSFVLLLCSAPSRPGFPLSCPLACPLSFLCFSSVLFFCAPAFSCFLLFRASGTLGLGAPSFLLFHPLPHCVFFARGLRLQLSLVSDPGCLGAWRCAVSSPAFFVSPLVLAFVPQPLWCAVGFPPPSFSSFVFPFLLRLFAPPPPSPRCLFFGSPRPAARVTLCSGCFCLIWVRCSLGRLFVCCAVLCRAVDRCCVL